MGIFDNLFGGGNKPSSPSGPEGAELGGGAPTGPMPAPEAAKPLETTPGTIPVSTDAKPDLGGGASSILGGLGGSGLGENKPWDATKDKMNEEKDAAAGSSNSGTVDTPVVGSQAESAVTPPTNLGNESGPEEEKSPIPSAEPKPETPGFMTEADDAVAKAENEGGPLPTPGEGAPQVDAPVDLGNESGPEEEKGPIPPVTPPAEMPTASIDMPPVGPDAAVPPTTAPSSEASTLNPVLEPVAEAVPGTDTLGTTAVVGSDASTPSAETAGNPMSGIGSLDVTDASQGATEPALNPTATADVNSALASGGIDSLDSTPSTPDANPGTSESPTASTSETPEPGNDNSGTPTGAPPTPATV